MGITDSKTFSSDSSENEIVCSNGEHSIYLDEIRGEKVCSLCGLVFEEHIIDYYNGERFYSPIEKMQNTIHYGLPLNPLTPAIGNSTMIEKKGQMSFELRKAIVWEKRYPWKERNLIRASFEIKRLGELLGLPQHTKDNSIKIYRNALAKGILKGRTIQGMVAACVYSACRIQKVPRTLKDISLKSECTYHKILRSYMILCRTLNLKLPTVDFSKFINNAILQLDLNLKYMEKLKVILDRYKSHYSFNGKDPKGIIAASLYYLTELNSEKCNQKTIADIMKTSDVTLRQRLKEIRKLFKAEERYPIPAFFQN